VSFCFLLVCFVIYTSVKKKPHDIKNNNSSTETKYQKNHTFAENADVLVDKLTFASKTSDNDSYSIVADKAYKVKDGGYNMNQIVANFGVGANIIEVLANNGYYNEAKNNLILSNKITGAYLGYTLKAESLELEIATKILRSNSPVFIESEKISVSSDGMSTEGENKLIFEGHVKTRINFDQ